MIARAARHFAFRLAVLSAPASTPLPSRTLAHLVERIRTRRNRLSTLKLTPRVIARRSAAHAEQRGQPIEPHLISHRPALVDRAGTHMHDGRLPVGVA